ncbi:adenosylcobinamide-GDP ribazoletransferase [Angustibacter luteus]|uniref:Adenosylcobinamide-GDP ribazoletransferase n=1 Tax=Angustibacter luteus TaxID=658456 RepID=A0ABW1JBY3_9ACTN
MSRPGALRDGVRLATGTLTVLPVPAPVTVDREAAGRAMALAGLVALLPGSLVALVGWAGSALGAPPLLVGAVAVGALAWSSRGLHLDGLADTADGLAASYDRERALAVMRTGDVGPIGAATLVLVLLAQVACVAALVEQPLLSGAAVVVSRAVLALACASGVPAARSDGLGAMVAGSVPRWAAGSAVLLAGVVVTLAALASGTPWWSGPLAAALAVLAAGAVLVRCTRRLGGITGDVLGALVEVSLAATLAVLATAA